MTTNFAVRNAQKIMQLSFLNVRNAILDNQVPDAQNPGAHQLVYGIIAQYLPEISRDEVFEAHQQALIAHQPPNPPPAVVKMGTMYTGISNNLNAASASLRYFGVL